MNIRRALLLLVDYMITVSGRELRGTLSEIKNGILNDRDDSVLYNARLRSNILIGENIFIFSEKEYILMGKFLENLYE